VLTLINPKTGQRFPIPEGTTDVGRTDAGGVGLDHPSVSRIHARLYHVAEGFWVEDLGSTNGTFVHGSRLDEPVNLSIGDKVQFGALIFTLVEEEEPQVEQPDLQEEISPVESTVHQRKTTPVPREVIQDAIAQTAFSSPSHSTKPLPKKYELSDSGRIRPQGSKPVPVVNPQTAFSLQPEPSSAPVVLYVALGTGIGALGGVILGFFLGRL